jgi:hypothetical protein
LFDLVNDPGEQHDVASMNAEMVARLKASYDRLAKEFPESAKKGDVKRNKAKGQRDRQPAR